MLESDGMSLSDLAGKCVSGKGGVMNVVMEAHRCPNQRRQTRSAHPSRPLAQFLEVAYLHRQRARSSRFCGVVCRGSPRPIPPFYIPGRLTGLRLELSEGSLHPRLTPCVSRSFFAHFLMCSTLLDVPMVSVRIR